MGIYEIYDNGNQMNEIELIGTCSTTSLLEQYSQIEHGIKWITLGAKSRQVGLQYKETEDPWSSAVGTQRHETEYTILNPFFKDTLFEDIINKYNLIRTRLMWVNPYSCYSMHTDSTYRIHVPIITNPQCFFVFKKGIVQHLSAGSIYRLDTTKSHTFMNCSDTPRLHLIGCIG